MRAILDFFKEKNAQWPNIESVVIDKDYTEWIVLEDVFPAAKVILCQCHAVTYWKKLVQRPQYTLTVSTREELLGFFGEVVFAYVQSHRFRSLHGTNCGGSS